MKKWWEIPPEKTVTPMKILGGFPSKKNHGHISDGPGPMEKEDMNYFLSLDIKQNKIIRQVMQNLSDDKVVGNASKTSPSSPMENASNIDQAGEEESPPGTWRKRGKSRYPLRQPTKEREKGRTP